MLNCFPPLRLLFKSIDKFHNQIAVLYVRLREILSISEFYPAAGFNSIIQRVSKNGADICRRDLKPCRRDQFHVKWIPFCMAMDCLLLKGHQSPDFPYPGFAYPHNRTDS